MRWSVPQLLGGGCITLVVAFAVIVVGGIAALRPDVTERDPTVRAPEAPPARVVDLPGWTAIVLDPPDADGRVRKTFGTVGGLAIREAEGALLVRGLRFRSGGGAPDTLPTLRLVLDSLVAQPATPAEWRAAGPATGDCPGAWRVEGDPYRDASSRTRPAAPVAEADPDAIAGAHVDVSSGAADGRSEAVVSAAGPRTDWSTGRVDLDGLRYLDVVPLVEGAPHAGPVRLPKGAVWEAPCWSPSGRFVVVPSRPSVILGPPGPEAVRLAVLRVGP
ncbi:hypothetical protein [Rubrivirga sp. IMCC45206]|uniref:hypothetical protein n=1 Tax=Rubrivirga sp. IMCC45206 TaxID=3391614 RepID=UPI0039902C1D